MRKFLAVFYLSLFLSASFTVADANTEIDSDKLLTLNNASLNAYETAKSNIQQSLDPTIVIFGGHLTYRYHHKEQQFKIVPIEYTQLKTFAQLTLGIFSFAHLAQQSDWLGNLKNYREKMLIAAKTIDNLTNLTAAQRARQKQIVALSQNFIDKILLNKKISDADLNNYFQAINPLIWQNVNEASIAQINLLQQIMQSLQAQTPAQDWKKLKVIVIGLHMPRQHNIITQYFSKRLQTDIDTPGLIYGEGLSSETDGLDLLSRMDLDTQLGKTVFNDPKRMRRDLLGDDAERYLQKLFPKKNL